MSACPGPSDAIGRRFASHRVHGRRKRWSRAKPRCTTAVDPPLPGPCPLGGHRLDQVPGAHPGPGPLRDRRGLPHRETTPGEVDSPGEGARTVVRPSVRGR